MKKFLPLVMVLALCTLVSTLIGCCSWNETRYAKQQTDVISRLNSQTVALEATNDEGAYFPYCTGVWVARDKILTANHCVEAWREKTEEATNAPVEKNHLTLQYIVQDEVTGKSTDPNGIHDAQVIAWDDDKDVALLQASDKVPDHDVAQLALKVPDVGSKLHVVGQVVGLYWTYIPVTLSADRPDGWIDDFPVKGSFLQIVGPVFHGNSGGGCFTEDGYLLGIVSFMSEAPQISFIVHLDTIRAFLQDNHVKT